MNELTNSNSTFSHWHKELHAYAVSRGGSAADADAWREDYENGLTPKEAYDSEWGEDE